MKISLVSLRIPSISLLVSVLAATVILKSFHVDPFVVYAQLVKGSLTSFYDVSELLIKMRPIALVAIGYSLTFTFTYALNIGGEGQFIAGAIGAAGVAIFLPVSIPIVVIPLAIAAGCILAMIWAVIPILIRRVNVTLSSFLLNFVVIGIAKTLYENPWKDPSGGFARTKLFPETAWFPVFPGTRLPLDLFIVIFMAIVMWLFLERTVWGQRIKLVGNNARLAFRTGSSARSLILRAMLIGGFFAGMAGSLWVLGVSHRLQDNIAAQYGYTAMPVAWLAKRNPLLVIIISFVTAMLLVGETQVQKVTGVSWVGRLLLWLFFFTYATCEAYLKWRNR